MSTWIWVALAVLVVGWAVWLFNRLVRYRNRADEGWAQIDVQLRRRYDLIPNLIASVQGYAAHDAIPGSRLEVFEGAGHFPHCEEPARFVDVVTDFMQSTTPAVLEPSQLQELLQAAKR